MKILKKMHKNLSILYQNLAKRAQLEQHVEKQDGLADFGLLWSVIIRLLYNGCLAAINCNQCRFKQQSVKSDRGAVPAVLHARSLFSAIMGNQAKQSNTADSRCRYLHDSGVSWLDDAIS